MRLRKLSSQWWHRPAIYTLIAALLSSGGWVVTDAHERETASSIAALRNLETLEGYSKAASAYRTLENAIASAVEEGLEVASYQNALERVASLMAAREYESARALAIETADNVTSAVGAAQTARTQAEEEAKRYGLLSLTVTNGPNAAVIAKTGDVETSGVTNDQGALELKLLVGSYTVTVTKSGYSSATVSDIVITSLATTSASTTLTPLPAATARPRPTATPTPSSAPASSSTAHSSYRRETIQSSRGSYVADIAQFELGPGKIQVITDTAADTDCNTNCPVLSIGSYVSRFPGAVAAINGTYFCPADYAWCSPNEVNAFFWKIKNPRTGTMINQHNGLGEYDGFLVFAQDGTARYLNTWSGWDSYGSAVWAGINHKPTLVRNGSYSVDENQLDSKQRTSKISRGALGLKGQTLYAVIVQSATIMDAAAVMVALGVDTALNLDGGGSSALWYNGSYKRGPGRGVPNALVFVQQ